MTKKAERLAFVHGACWVAGFIKDASGNFLYPSSKGILDEAARLYPPPTRVVPREYAIEGCIYRIVDGVLWVRSSMGCYDHPSTWLKLEHLQGLADLIANPTKVVPEEEDE